MSQPGTIALLGNNYSLQIIETQSAEQFYASYRMGPAPICLKISARIAERETYRKIPLKTRLFSNWSIPLMWSFCGKDMVQNGTILKKLLFLITDYQHLLQIQAGQIRNSVNGRGRVPTGKETFWTTIGTGTVQYAFDLISGQCINKTGPRR